MDKKKKINIVVIVPVIVTVIIACAVIYFVMQAGMAGGAQSADAAMGEPPPMPAHHESAGENAGEGEMEMGQGEENQATPACGFDEWIGQPVDEAAVSATGRPFRILPPGSIVTMDFNPERINIHTDDEGIVAYITCG